MAFIGLNVLLILGAAPIIGVALLLRQHRLASRILFPLTLVIVHSAILAFCIALYPTGIFLADIPYDDVYGAYLFFPGIDGYWVGGAVAGLLWPWLQSVMPYHAASMMCIVFIPGIVGLGFGAVQWYFIGYLMDRFGLTTRWSELATRAVARFASRSP